jgi:ABC-2 type transport system permease protein
MSAGAAISRQSEPHVADTLAGTGALLRLALRRDRVRLPIWIASLGLTVVGFGVLVASIYADPAELRTRAELIGHPAAIAFGGPGIGVQDYTIGALLTNEMLGYFAILLAVMNILLVVRHTRADEQAGRTELVRAGPVGRHAASAAALILAVGANLAIAAVVALGLGMAGIESVDWTGAWLFALAVCSVGIVFAAIAMIAAEMVEYSGRAAGFAFIVLALSFIARAIGDVSMPWLSWLSPLGWAQRTYAFVDNTWWPLLLAIVIASILVTIAFWINGRRDFAAGLVRPAPGPARAADSLLTPFGLAWRLQRSGFIGWFIGIMAFALLYGPLLGQIEAFAGQMGAIQTMLEHMDASVIDALLAHLVSLLVIFAATYGAIFAALRVRSEEILGYAEPMLSTGVSRTRWLLSHAGVAALTSTAILLVSGFALGATGAIAAGDPGILTGVLAASAVYIAPLLLTIAFAIALFGFVPSASHVALWVFITLTLAVGKLGEIFGLPPAIYRLSPFSAVPRLPAEDFSATPVVMMLVAAAALTFAGLAGFRRRDLEMK